MAGKSISRQNFAPESENGINKQIGMELSASYSYMSMACYFDRDDVALKGLYKYFKKRSDEERYYAKKLMKYQNKRGGRVQLQDQRKPSKDDWNSPLESFEAALAIEKSINEALFSLHNVAENSKDPQLADYLEREFLGFRVKGLKDLAEKIANLKRVGSGLGEFQFDQEVLKESFEHRRFEDKRRRKERFAFEEPKERFRYEGRMDPK